MDKVEGIYNTLVAAPKLAQNVAEGIGQGKLSGHLFVIFLIK